MSMSIGSSFSLAASQSASVSSWQQQQQDLKALTSALQSGNLPAAKQAYAALTANGAPSSNSPLAQVGQALQSGNLGAAQAAMQKAQASHGGHHHHHGGGADVAAASTTSTTATTSPASSPNVGSLVNTSA